ncbi:MAG: M20 family peptidase [Flavobacteriaceae bacterium]|nr:M20 family peptidase [Flavobacteriaceae bacterium]
MFKKILLGILAIILILLAIIAFKTSSYQSKQMQTEAVELVHVNSGYAERLAKAISYKTISYTDKEADTLVYRDFLQFMEETYPLVDSLLEKTTINEFSLVYKWPGTDPSLKPVLLMAHSDVVPIEKATLNKWEMDPFSGTIKDGYIFGRGTMDDKGNGLAIMEAITLHLQKGFQPKRTLYFSFGHDEEVGGPNGAANVAAHFKKQNIQFEYVLDEGGVFMEKGFFPGINQPAALIGIAEKGYVSLRFTAKVEEAGHSSMPPKETAIGILADAIQKIEENPFPAHLNKVTEQMFAYLGPEMAMPSKAIFANQWLFKSTIVGILADSPTSNAMVRTTVAPTILQSGVKDNVLPTEATLIANFRLIPGDTGDGVIAYLKESVNDPRVTIEPMSKRAVNNPSPISPVDSKAFACLQKTVGQVAPDRLVAPLLLVAGTDCKHFVDLSENIYRTNPIAMKKSDIPRIHGINERVPVKAYEGAIQFFYQLIANNNTEL